jgi:hypothetical protein
MNFFKKFFCSHRDSIFIDDYGNFEVKESPQHRKILRKFKNFKGKSPNVSISPIVEKHKCKSCATTFLVYKIGFGYKSKNSAELK